MAQKRCYGNPPVGVGLHELDGLLVVIEGPDASGRSTHIQLLSMWLEQRGYPVARTGLTRSKLVAQALDNAKLGNVLSPRTMSLFYATDFYDQLENVIVPALRAGSIVLADRYIFTMMARDAVRGADRSWLRSLYSMAIVPDVVFYFSVTLDTLVERALADHGHLDYWESGMDLGISRDWYTSFIRYQESMREEFGRLEAEFAFETVDVNRTLTAVQKDLRAALDGVIARAYPKGRDESLKLAG